MKPICLSPCVSWLLGLGSLVFLFSGVGSPGHAAQFGRPYLTFTEPLSGRPYMASTNVPIVLRAFAPDDVILSAEVFADGSSIGVATFCCSLCPCAHPSPGEETLLQIPTPWQGGLPPSDPWQGWTNPPSGVHQ